MKQKENCFLYIKEHNCRQAKKTSQFLFLLGRGESTLQGKYAWGKGGNRPKCFWHSQEKVCVCSLWTCIAPTCELDTHQTGDMHKPTTATTYTYIFARKQNDKQRWRRLKNLQQKRATSSNLGSRSATKNMNAPCFTATIFSFGHTKLSSGKTPLRPP